ncbi:MAG: DEAD/DEAH box helicase family protein [Candidatus Gracilibacteria bacterium]|nr:DEAD/DEAH box helicase family protein [Candidatus Gracilibacteria bacterium]
MSIDISRSMTLRKRPYQSQAISSLLDFVKKYLDGVLETTEQKYESAGLLEMATGSGKTFTVGKYLDLLFKLRNSRNRKLEKARKQKEYEGLNILVLTNRIDGLNQFRDDLVHGRPTENKPPIISIEVLENMRVSTFHSKADNLDDIDPSLFTQDETDDVEVFSEQNGRKKDNIFFATDRTANLKNIESKIPYFDIIIIDETHNVKGGNDFEDLIDKLSVHGRDGKAPLILPITATPTNKTEELFGEPIFSYPLAEYLASEYSPSIEYKLITSSKANRDDIESISRMVEDAKQVKDYKDKKELLRAIEEKFEGIMLKVPNLQELVSDLLTRLIAEDDEIKETIIFASSIDDVNNIVKQINQEYGEDIASAYHSKDRDGLDKLKDKSSSTKIVVAVDMLNESIDLPVVSNIVFWRGTDVARIYLQQFGRGLRGNGLVRYYDYVGGMQNFAWIGGIYENYKGIVGDDGDDMGGEGGCYGGYRRFKLLGGDIGIQEHSIDLSGIGFGILDIKKSLELKTLDDYKRYFEEHIDEFEKFGCIFSEESGVKTVNLNGIGNPNKNKIFLLFASNSLKNLNLLLGNPDIGCIKNRPQAQKILKQFFEGMGYNVILEIKEKQKLETLEDYQRYFENTENRQEFLTFGIIIDDKIKTINLNNIKRPTIGILFGISPQVSIRILGKLLGIEGNGDINNKSQAQKILKQFFEGMGYNVVLEIKEKKRLETLQDYEEYFKDSENEQEFLRAGMLINTRSKVINLYDMGTPAKFKIFGYHGETSLRKLNKLLGNEDLGPIKNIPNSQRILKQFFENIGYSVNTRKEKGPIDVQIIRDYFDRCKIEQPYPFGPEEKRYTVERRRDLKINGHGLHTVAKIMGIEGNPISNTDVWYELLDKIYKYKQNITI